jgi:hypothetical protein
MKIRCWMVLLVQVWFAITAFSQEPASGGPPTNAIQLRVAGSSVVDPYGIFCGNIEAVALDPRSHQILFAMVATDYPSNRMSVTPVPWPLLQQYADARESVGVPGTFQQFKATADRLTILRAPKVQLTDRTNDLAWMTGSHQYFNSAPVGGSSPATGSVAGSASGFAATPPPGYGTEGVAYAPGYSGGFYGGGFYGGGVLSPLDSYLLYGASLFGPDFLTNVYSPQIAGTNLAFATNLLVSYTNFFRTNTSSTSNLFAGNRFATNIFGRHGHPTNVFAGNNDFLFRSNSFSSFGTNLPVLRSNFVATFPNNAPSLGASNVVGGGFNNPPPAFRGPDRPVNPGAVGAPAPGTGAGSGTFAPYIPPQQPQPPAQPAQPPPPQVPAQPTEPYPKRPLQPVPARPAAPTAPAQPR